MKVVVAHETLSGPFRDVYPDLEIWKTQKEADLVIFTGGEDISPEIYKAKPDGAYGTNPERDKREILLLKKIVDGTFSAGKVLGVCRGHQLISAYLGMDLIQDIYSLGISHASNHDIYWERGTIFSEYERVNSMHHQVVSKKSHALFKDNLFPCVLAREPQEGLCESILWGENILGVQFHPEFMEWSEKERFFDLINQWISGKPFYTKKVKGELREKKKINYSNMEDIIIREAFGRDIRERPTPVIHDLSNISIGTTNTNLTITGLEETITFHNTDEEIF